MAREHQIVADQANGGEGTQWPEDDPPACQVGMDLLQRFREARPTNCSFLHAKDIVDLSTSAFQGIPKWDAFAEHCDTCEDCNA